MVKKVLLKTAWLLVALLLPTVANAQQEGSSSTTDKTMALVIEKTDASQIEFQLDEMPKLTVVNGDLVVNSKGAITRVPLTTIARLVYKSNELSGIEAPATTKRYTRQGDRLVLQSLPAGTAVNLYTVDGQLVNSYKANGNSPVVLSLTTLPAGIYVVETNNLTFKIQK